jgi:D-glycero-D-manno-heptose 1,7-bisphosphate phosphatase
MKAAIFLDRDGVVIENRDGYVRSWSDVEFLPGALNALARLNSTLFKIVLVSNQSAVGRGLLTLEMALELHERIVAKVRDAGGRVDDSFLCPHAPWEDCQCRKPQPGLLFQAARKHGLDLGRSYMVGDALSDIQAGRFAGVSRLVLVLTGRGKHQMGLAEAKELGPFDVFPRLGDFVDYLVSTALEA